MESVRYCGNSEKLPTIYLVPVLQPCSESVTVTDKVIPTKTGPLAISNDTDAPSYGSETGAASTH